MARRLLDYNAFNGTTTYFHYNDLTDETIIETVGDTSASINAATELRNDEEYTRKGMKKDVLHYGHVPDAILMKWHGEGVNINDTSELFRMINKPEYGYLKTTTLHHRPKG